MSDEERGIIEEHLEPIKEWWDSKWSLRPWWLRKAKWKWVLYPIKPDFKGAWNYVKKYQDYPKLYREIEELGASYPDIFVRLERFVGGSSSILVYLSVKEEIPDIEPFMEELFERGWTTDRHTDRSRSRQYNLVHIDREVSLHVVAHISYGANCKVIEHKKLETKETTEYEILCEGEAELTGRKL